MKKTLKILLFLPWLISLFSLSFSAENVTEIFDSVQQEIGYGSFFESIPEESLEFFETYGIDLSPDAEVPGFSKTLNIVCSVFLAVLSEHLPLLFTGIAVLLLFKLFTSFCRGKDRLTESLAYLTVISSGVYSFAAIEGVLTSLTEISQRISSFLTAALPVVCSAQVWSGSSQGAGVISAVLPAVFTVISSLITAFYYPLCWFCYAASLSGFFRERISLRPLVLSVKKICTRGVEILSGLSVGVFCVQRAVLASANTVARRGVHFALAQILPMAGAALSNGIETVYACGKSLSGKIGVLCVLTVAAMFVVPCILGLIFVTLYSFLSSMGSLLEIPLLADFYADIKDTFAMMTSFAVCSLIVLSSAILLLTGV